jgi:uncharacterized protein (DUF983 family)
LAQLSYGTAASRALKLRCPRCGKGPLFKNFFVMYEHCPECSLKYERAPGYFLGSTYVNYGFMMVTMIPAYFALHYLADISNETLAIPLLVYCVIMPLFLFRYARSWWLAMDCYCDPIGFGLHADPTTESSAGDANTRSADQTEP